MVFLLIAFTVISSTPRTCPDSDRRDKATVRNGSAPNQANKKRILIVMEERGASSGDNELTLGLREDGSIHTLEGHEINDVMLAKAITERARVSKNKTAQIGLILFPREKNISVATLGKALGRIQRLADNRFNLSITVVFQGFLKL